MIYLKYSGTAENKFSIRKLVDEFSDIARISGWKYEIVNENFNTLTRASWRSFDCPENDIGLDEEDILTLNSADVFLEGIILGIDSGMDPLRLTFDKKGKLAAISFCTTDTVGLNKKLTVKKYEFLYYPYLKLYTIDAEKHKKVVKILDYLKKTYIKDLEVIDNSFYWDNRDEEELKVRMWKASRPEKTITNY